MKTRQGRGRRPILQAQTDLEAVRRAVQKNRQRISLAKAELEQELGKEFSQLTPRHFLKNGCRFKRLRRRLKRTPPADLYGFKRECLTAFEQLSERGHIDLFYGEESGVSLLPCVPYAWQFADEQVALPSERLGALSLSLRRLTVVVLDNASIHKKAAKERWAVWQARGLFVFFLPPYSPHLTLITPNIAEVLWRKFKYDKYEWLCPEDYATKEALHLAVWQALAAVGQSLKIRFQPLRTAKTAEQMG